jgi:hypothetical protein
VIAVESGGRIGELCAALTDAASDSRIVESELFMAWALCATR